MVWLALLAAISLGVAVRYRGVLSRNSIRRGGEVGSPSGGGGDGDSASDSESDPDSDSGSATATDRDVDLDADTVCANLDGVDPDGATPDADTANAADGRDENAESDADAEPDADDDPVEYILDLLAANGGRMKQQWIVDARDWSAPVVSQHLIEMEERGLVVRYSLGRENAICLPEFALDAER